MKRIVLLIALLLTASCAWAQKPTLGTPVAKQSGSDIVVEYSIQMEPGIVCNIAVYLSCDGGRHFSKKALQKVTGDVGTISQSGQKSFVWHVLDEEEALTGDDLVFKVNVERYWYQSLQDSGQSSARQQARPAPQPFKPALFVAPVVGLMPDMSYGLMAGYAGKIGAYGKFRSNFVNTGSTYDCTSDGKTGGGYIWTTGKSQVSLMSFTAGVLLPLGRSAYPYVGIGYAKRELAWEDVKGQWARVSDASVSGIGLEAGLMIRFGLFGLHAGVNSAAFKNLGVDAGLALFF